MECLVHRLRRVFILMVKPCLRKMVVHARDVHGPKIFGPAAISKLFRSPAHGHLRPRPAGPAVLQQRPRLTAIVQCRVRSLAGLYKLSSVY